MPGDMYCMPVSYIPATTQQGNAWRHALLVSRKDHGLSKGVLGTRLMDLPAQCEKPISITLPSHDMLYSDLYGYIGYRVRAGINY